MLCPLWIICCICRLLTIQWDAVSYWLNNRMKWFHFHNLHMVVCKPCCDRSAVHQTIRLRSTMPLCAREREREREKAIFLIDYCSDCFATKSIYYSQKNKITNHMQRKYLYACISPQCFVNNSWCLLTITCKEHYISVCFVSRNSN